MANENPTSSFSKLTTTLGYTTAVCIAWNACRASFRWRGFANNFAGSEDEHTKELASEFDTASIYAFLVSATLTGILGKITYDAFKTKK